MKLKNFFINCLNRKSFQFLYCVGIFLFVIPVVYWRIACISDYIANVFAGGFLVVLFSSITLFLPSFGLITLLSILIIYFKLLYKEHKNSEYRIKNKFLTQNPIYGLFAFCFYIFAILCILALLYLISVNLTTYRDPIFLNTISLYKYPFIIYIVILAFIIKKIWFYFGFIVPPYSNEIDTLSRVT